MLLCAERAAREVRVEKLKRLRTRKGYSQTELSEISKVAQHTISEIEQGRRTPHGRTLRKLAAALEVDVPALLTEEPEEAPKAADSQSDDGVRVVRGKAHIRGSATVRVSGEVIRGAILDVLRRRGLLGAEDADAFAEEVAEEVARRAA
jgi:transcriptional regulator with XRE-family HTH domain